MTPLGKITVIKSLLISRLNHLFISLPNPNENIISNINNIFFNFLWEGPARIKKTIIVKQYSDGGLKMINLKAFISSLKLTWIRRVLKSNSPWKLLFDNTININKLLHFGHIYCDSTIINISNCFWKDVLISYKEFLQACKPQEVEEFLSSPLYYNNNILIDGLTIFYNTWYKKGMVYVNDFYNDNGSLFSMQELQDIYGIKTNFLTYNGIIAAINSFKCVLPNGLIIKKTCISLKTKLFLDIFQN